MSLNVSGTRFVHVYDTELKLQVSDKIVFARLSTSRKDSKHRQDMTEELQDAADAAPERKYSSWNARFVGEAFEPAKGLSKGESIDIIKGWIVNEPYEKRDGSKGYSSYVTISEFALSDLEG